MYIYIYISKTLKPLNNVLYLAIYAAFSSST